VVEDPEEGKLRTIAQDEIGLMRGHNFGWQAFRDSSPERSSLKLTID
jgi:hypothetical protein